MGLASIFQNHDVLQRGLPLPIWWRGKAGECTSVQLAGHNAQAEVDNTGHWLLRILAISPRGTYELGVQTPSDAVRVSDILVGGVWLCSGQSNMEWRSEQTAAEWAMDTPDLPRVLLLTITAAACLGRTDSVDGSWKLCTAESIPRAPISTTKNCELNL